MAENNLSHYIPGHLNDQGKFLFFDYDVAGIALIGIFIGIFVSQPILGFMGGISAAYGYSTLKSGAHPGMAQHLLYWITGIPTPKELPSSDIRELIG